MIQFVSKSKTTRHTPALKENVSFLFYSPLLFFCYIYFLIARTRMTLNYFKPAKSRQKDFYLYHLRKIPSDSLLSENFFFNVVGH